MNALIISDIHGSHQALETALNTPLDYDLLILVGDHMYHGPRNPVLPDYNPQKVADRLNAVTKPILAVRGNCDSEVDQMLLNHSMMQDYTILHLNEHMVYLTHGHLNDPASYAPTTGADIFISGHTHLPGIETINKTILFNPGSIALPKGGHPASYGYLSSDSLSIYTLDHTLYKTHQL